MEQVIFFKGEENPLSNLYECTVCYNGFYYASSEHAYQYCKCYYHEEYDLCDSILKEESPRIVMNIGRKCDTTPDWNNMKLQIMNDILCAKFICCKPYRDILLQNKGKKLVEATYNKFWGGFGKGQNYLGKLHMEKSLNVIDYNHGKISIDYGHISC